RDANCRLWRFGLRRQRVSRHRRQRRTVHEHRELAGAAGEPHCHPAARGVRPPADDDRQPHHGHVLAVGGPDPRRRHWRGHLHLVAEAVLRGWKSTLVLLVVLLGLVGYIYFGDPGSSSDDREQAFASIEADDISEVEIKAADGERSVVRKTGGGT